MIRLHRRLSVTLLFLFGLFTVSTLRAQTDAGSISGVVRDGTGAAVPNASLTLRNTETGLTLERSADDHGLFVFSPVKIGNYEVSAKAAGFSTTVQSNIQLHVQQRLELDLAIKAGAVSETVDVSTAPPLLQTEDASTGQVVGTREINATPLNGRNWVFIAQLAAGVAPSNGARGQSKGDFSANGQRPEQNNFILDGVDNNVNVVDFLNGASFVVRPPPDALAEFKVQTGSYSAEFGHSAGAVINASLKSGTNAIHGNLWEYVRNDAFSIRDFGATTVSKYRQNQFGATLGLPILPNKLFFFGDVEANRIVFGEPGIYTVPTALMRNGDFSELLNTQLTGSTVPIRLFAPGSAGATPQTCNGQANVFCPGQISPIAQRLLKLYPQANYNSGRTYSNYFVSRNSIDNTWQFDTRLDWNATQHDQAFARFSYINEPAFHPSPLGQTLDGGSYGDSGSIKNFGQNFMLSETHTFTSSLVNEFRFGYNWGHFRDLQPNANTDVSSQLGLGGVPFAPLNGGLPYMTISGITGLGATQYYPANEYENVFQILDNVTKVAHGHALKAGLNLQHIRVYTLAPPNPRGSYNYTGKYTGIPSNAQTGYGVADFLVDSMNSAAISTLTPLDQMRWVRAGYLQDDWHASSRLTINAGLRYEFFQPNIERHDHQSRFDVSGGPLGPGTGKGVFVLPLSQQATPLPQAALNIFAKDNITVQYSANRSLLDAQKLNFAPRVGISFQVSPKMVLRTGYGIFFGGLESVGAYNLGFNYPYQFTSSLTSPSCTTASCATDGINLTTGFSQQLSAGLANSVTLPSLIGHPAQPKTAYSQQFNLTTEYSLSNNMVATVGYTGSLTRHLVSAYDTNAATALIAPGLNIQTVRPFQDVANITYINNGAVSNYNSLQAKLEKRYASGLSFLTSYTYAHTLDNAPSPLGSTGEGGYRAPNIAGIGIDYSNSILDVRQRLTFNSTYDLPFGFGRHWMNSRSVASYLLGNWSTSLLFRAQTGNPFTVTSNSTIANGTRAYPVRIGNVYAGGGSPNASNPAITCPAAVRTTQHWYNPCAFQNPLSGALITGSTQLTGPAALQYLGGKRNQIFTPGYNRTDMSLFKQFPTWREQYLQFRADAFNLFNTPAYGLPVQAINNNAGLITGTRALQAYTPDSRFFQFALKYVF